MKLKIENDSTSNLMDTQDLSSDVHSANGSAEVTEMLREGIKAAQDGNRADARHFLIQATELEPKNENAWLWLASISEYPEELLIFLNNVLRINPSNERALDWEKSTKSLLSKTFVKRGIEASKESQTELAKQSFLQAIVHDDKNEMAWLWLASISESVDEKKSHLQKVLRINPENETALNSLESLKRAMAKDLLRNAQMDAISGKTDSAKKMLTELLKNFPELEDAWLLKCFVTDSFSKKTEYLQKLQEINPDNERAAAGLAALKALAECTEPKPESSAEADLEIEVPETMLSAIDELPENFIAFQEVKDGPAAIELPVENKFDEEVPKFSIFDNKIEEEPIQEFEKIEEDLAAPEQFVEMTFDFSAETHDEESEMDQAFHEAESISFEDVPNELETSESNLISDDLPLYHEAVEEEFKTTVDETEPVFDNDVTSETFDTYEAAFDSISEQPVPESDPIEMPEELLELDDKTEEKPHAEMTSCPFCSTENEHLAFICQTCKAMMTMSDVDMMLDYNDADLVLVQQKVDQLEKEYSGTNLAAESLKLLGIGLLNLKNLRRGFEYLQEASQSDPNDVVLGSHVNALAIRLSEIDEQKHNHDSIPKNKTILVVDDSATVRKLVSGKLEKCGLEVICAVDGMDALEKINESIPDLILLDITMPRMDGYQVCKMIRGNDATKDVPVVMISGKDGFFDKVRGRMAGTTGYITKPFGPETLMKTVEAYIE